MIQPFNLIWKNLLRFNRRRRSANLLINMAIFDFHGFCVRRNGAACTNTPPVLAPSGFKIDTPGAAVDGHIPIQGDSAGMGLIYRVSDFLGMFFLLFLSEKMKKK